MATPVEKLTFRQVAGFAKDKLRFYNYHSHLGYLLLVILIVAELCFIALTTLPLLSVSSQFYLFDLLCNFQLQFFLTALLLGIILLWKSLKAGSVLLAMNILVFSVSHFWWLSTSSAVTRKPYLEVVQANLSYYNPEVSAAMTMLGKLEADLYLFYEFNQQQKPLFISFAEERYRFGDGDYDGFPSGIGVISKYPLKNINKLEILAEKGTVLTLTVQHPEQDIQLILLHPPSPRTPQLWQKRNRLLASVPILVENMASEHLLVAGDFNTTPWSSHFPRHEQLTPCYQQSGMYGSWYLNEHLHTLTWFAGLPIDHCLTGRRIALSHFTTLLVPGSDHAALHYQLSVIP